MIWILLQSFFLGSNALSNRAPQFYSQKEADLVMSSFQQPPIVLEFQSSNYEQSPYLAENDLIKHHKLVKQFCSHRRQKTCSWREYYAILNFIRAPYSTVYDPGIDQKGSLAQEVHGDRPLSESCEVLKQPPSASKFLTYVKESRPFVIKGGARKWHSTKKWTLKYLLRYLKSMKVPVSVSDTGDFVGPEPLIKWMNDTTQQYPEKEVLVRPESISIEFSDLVGVYKQFYKEFKRNISNRNPSIYMEYIPLSIVGKSLKKGVPDFYWSHILNPMLNLIWLGGGGNKMHCRLHFDSFENIMAVSAGTKVFRLYPPSQSPYLYGDSPLRAAGLRVNFNRNIGCSQSRATNAKCTPHYSFDFSRPVESISKESSSFNSYTPVDIRNPDFEQFPLLRKAKGFNCTVKKGDMIYIPSYWWHEVSTDGDFEGKSIGINYFFEPFYIRSKREESVILHKNRMYSHLDGVHASARPCTKKNVCFRRHRNKKNIIKSRKR